MFVLSAIAIFLCAKIVEKLFSSKGYKARIPLKSAVQASSQARSLRAYALAQGSCALGV